jgi:hypothetical protein
LKHASIVIAICATPDQLLKHLDETFETNFWNTWNIRLQHVYITIATYAISRSTFATFRWNTWTISWKHLKHFKHGIAGSYGVPSWGLR